MNIEAKVKISNHSNLSMTGELKAVPIHIAVLSDQEYDQFQNDPSLTCEQKKKAASIVLQTMLPTNGEWSTDIKHADNQSKGKAFALKRPKLYYVEVLDCDRQL